MITLPENLSLTKPSKKDFEVVKEKNKQFLSSLFVPHKQSKSSIEF